MKSTKLSLFSAKSALLSLLVLFVFSSAFVGCKQADDEDTGPFYPEGIEKLASNSALIGTWVETSAYGNSYYKISAEEFKNWGDGYESYEGNELVVGKIDETSGTIFIKYTKAATASWTYSSDPNEAPDVGRWYAVSYKGLSENAVQLSGAYGKVPGHTVTSTETLEEAIEEFTFKNGYFDTYSALARQNEAE